jgi:hypothetical protein
MTLKVIKSYEEIYTKERGEESFGSKAYYTSPAVTFLFDVIFKPYHEQEMD